jgi:Zn-finger nucleic acid-binding protein
MRNTSLTHLQQSHQGYWFPIQGAPALIETLKHQESSQKEHFQYYLQIQSYKKKKKKHWYFNTRSKNILMQIH